MAVFDIEAWGVWNGTSGFWTFIPREGGTEKVYNAPSQVAEWAKEGPNYNCPADGKVYRTWLVPGPRYPAPQQIVRWDSVVIE